jgi:hypothetical protein
LASDEAAAGVLHALGHDLDLGVRPGLQPSDTATVGLSFGKVF